MTRGALLRQVVLHSLGGFGWILSGIVALVEARAMEGDQECGITPLWEHQAARRRPEPHM